MLRSRKKDVNIKPNRKLDKRSSRGMLYENEELRLRTIEINAEVERGQCDLKKLRRENQRLRRDIWSLREEYERLESEMAKMRKGVGGMEEDGDKFEKRRKHYGVDDEREDGDENGDEDDGDEDEDEDDEFDGEEDEDEEDEEEENAENLQKVNYYNSGRLGVVEEGEGKGDGGIVINKVMEEGENSRIGTDCGACGSKKTSPAREEGTSSAGVNGMVTFTPGDNMEQLVKEMTPNGIAGQNGAARSLESGDAVVAEPVLASGLGTIEVDMPRGNEERNEEIAPLSLSKGCRKWLENKLNISTNNPNVSQDSSQASTPSSSTTVLPPNIPIVSTYPLHSTQPTPMPTPATLNTALLESSLSPEINMRDIFASLATRLDAVVGVRLLSVPGAATTSVLINLKTPQDLEALLRTGLEIRGHLHSLSDAASLNLQSCENTASPQNIQNAGIVNTRLCKENELGSVKEEDEGVDEHGRVNVVVSANNAVTYDRLSSSIPGLPRTRSPSPACQRQSHSLSLPSTPLPSAANSSSPKFPGQAGVDKQFGHCRSASADAGNEPPNKQKVCVNFEENCAGAGGKGPTKKKTGILRRNVSQEVEEGEGGAHSCNHHPKPCRIHLQRSFSLDPRGSFHRRKGIGSERTTRAREDGGSGMEADSEASRRGGSVSSRGSSGAVNGAVKSKGSGRNRSPNETPSKDLPWCGCWGNGCF